MKSGFWTGLISGALATLFGFTLTILWDNHRFNRDIGQRDKALINSFRQEIKDNRQAATLDQQLLVQESELLKANHLLVEPLVSIRLSARDLIAANLPSRVNQNEGLLISIARMSQTAQEVNDLIKERESYRLANISNPNPSLFVVIRRYDERLNVDIDTFLKSAGWVEGELQSF